MPSVSEPHSEKVRIGDQVWMAKNLNVDRFRNGDIIPEARTADEWMLASKNKQAAWCYYDNNPTNGSIFGKLYNWYAVNDPRGLAPEGWHIPSDEEWTQLGEFLIAQKMGALELKSTSGWLIIDSIFKSDENGNNKTGFNAKACGFRDESGSFHNEGTVGIWWSATISLLGASWYRSVKHEYDMIRGSHYMDCGFSVRCLANDFDLTA